MRKSYSYRYLYILYSKVVTVFAMGLAKRIREGTKTAHQEAEKSSAIVCFLKGVVERESYVQLLADLYFVYSKLELEVTKHKNLPAIKAIYRTQLERTKALEKDLKYFLGDDWEDNIVATPACEALVTRLDKISKSNPELLVSHHYTRYMGDLSGGQALKNITKSALQLPNTALNFYTFTRIKDPTEFKAEYRESLDNIKFVDAREADVVQEAIKAFKYNSSILEQMEGNLVKSIGKVLFGFLTRH